MFCLGVLDGCLVGCVFWSVDWLRVLVGWVFWLVGWLLGWLRVLVGWLVVCFG